MLSALEERRLIETLAEARAPRYTSYPTAVQFGPGVDAQTYAGWLAALPDDRPVSVYVHIPFCRRLCLYCGCNMQVARRQEPVTDYVQLLDREIELAFWARGRGLTASTLHLGGGSPDCLSPADLERLFASLRYAFHLPKDMAFDVEIDPAHVSEDFIRAAARFGLTRASLGVQTFAPAVQAAIHRPQSVERVSEVVAALRSAGVQGVNFDLMYGLPKQTLADVIDTIDQALALQPSRIAVFGYAHMPQLKAHQKVFAAETLPGVVERMAQAEAAADRLVGAGYVRIGLDHFALPDDAMARAATTGGLHRNFQGYTTDAAETLIGLGVSAISRLPQGYAQNAHGLGAWRAALSQGRLPVERGVAFTGDDRLRADIIERLMCDGWVDLAAACERHNGSARDLESIWDPLVEFVKDGLVELYGELVHVTPRGRFLIRTLCTAFDRYYEPERGRHSVAV